MVAQCRMVFMVSSFFVTAKAFRPMNSTGVHPGA